VKRALLFLTVAALWNPTHLFAATITLTPNDPRIDNPNLIDRDWGARLRNFRNRDDSEIYIGSGDLSFAGNRKVADMIWNDTSSAPNPFTFTYAPSSPRITMTVSVSTSASQFYDFQTPVPNSNQPFNNLLIQLKSPQGNPQVIITNLMLSISGGSTTNLGTVQPSQGSEVWARISDIESAYTSGFTLSGNVVYAQLLYGADNENPVINFFSLFDGTQTAADLTLTKTHAGNFTQGQTGATYTVTVRNIGLGPTTGTVIVTDNLPPALAATAAAGPGWTCNISVNTATCARSDPLAPGASYPPRILTHDAWHYHLLCFQ
jgi:uncharacterized repeat protein (TIGR01451 family)